MKRSTLSTFFGIALLVLFAPCDSQAQSSAPPNAGGSKQDQLIQELLGEVRQLRIALQHISVNAYRGQVLVERLRLQQEQVNRLSQELNSTRNQISDLKSTQLTAKTRLDETEKQQDKGLESEQLTARYREVLEEVTRHEQRLTDREIQVAAQLEAERANLTDLNKRLDALELEMMVTGERDDAKGRVKR
jgi:DNA repair exonuclease SbcCD ATPase subunit